MKAIGHGGECCPKCGSYSGMDICKMSGRRYCPQCFYYPDTHTPLPDGRLCVRCARRMLINPMGHYYCPGQCSIPTAPDTKECLSCGRAMKINKALGHYYCGQCEVDPIPPAALEALKRKMQHTQTAEGADQAKFKAEIAQEQAENIQLRHDMDEVLAAAIDVAKAMEKLLVKIGEAVRR